jgi:hypothetical protein
MRERLEAEALEASLTPEERAKAAKTAKAADRAESMARLTYGYLNPEIVCPHCQTKGQVRTKQIKQKKGISGGKATGAVLNGGLSLIATGLSRKEQTTKATCGNCHSTWFF